MTTMGDIRKRVGFDYRSPAWVMLTIVEAVTDGCWNVDYVVHGIDGEAFKSGYPQPACDEISKDAASDMRRLMERWGITEETS